MGHAGFSVTVTKPKFVSPPPTPPWPGQATGQGGGSLALLRAGDRVAPGGPGPLGTEPFLCPNPAGDMPTVNSWGPVGPPAPKLHPIHPAGTWSPVPNPQLLSPCGCPRTPNHSPVSIPPWQSRGVGEAERQTERGMRDRQTDRDGGEGRRRMGRHSD